MDPRLQTPSPADREVLGTDDRRPVTRPEKVPFRYICRLRIGNGGCTGALIAPDVVLTAAHCLHAWGRGPRPPIRAVTFGDGGEGLVARVRRFAVPAAYRNAASKRASFPHDFAVVFLDRPWGHRTGWWPIRAWSARVPLRGRNVVTAGYPGDRGGRFVVSRGRVVDESAHLLEYSNDTMPGQSGSPVWILDGSQPRLVAVHKREDDPRTPKRANVGVALRPSTVRWIRARIREDRKARARGAGRSR